MHYAWRQWRITCAWHADGGGVFVFVAGMASGAEAARLKDELRTRELEIELLQQVRVTSVTVDVCRPLSLGFRV